MTRAQINGISPLFIVSDVPRTVAFYCEKLGFEAECVEPENDPFFAIVRRDGAGIFFKSDRAVSPMPNTSRHPWIKWDAYVYVPDPDALAAEFAGNGITLHTPVADTSENLHGFEVRDPDGYILFFGHPN